MFDYNQGSFERFSPVRSRITGSHSYGLSYPSPFFDVAQTYLPDTIRRLFRWCRYFFLTNPTISAVINKMAEYPITDVVVEHRSSTLVNQWEEFLEETLQLRKFLLDLGLYYYAYGNAMVSIQYPFTKYLKCKDCGTWTSIRDATYRFHTHRFILNPCPHCGTSGEAEAKDVQIKSPRDIKLVIWNPEDITVVHNDITGDDSYFFRVPRSVKNDIMLGKPHVIETMPQIVIDAVRQQKQLRLYKSNFFHMRRPSMLTGTKDAGMGIPMLLPVLKDSFLLQVLKKSNEAVALERIYPLSIIFPQAGSATSDPYGTIDLTKWRDHVQAEINRWRRDRAYVPIMPLPLGHQVIGGDGRGLLTFQEMQMLNDHIIAGMQVPREFIQGGLSWSGSNVSMRMLENHFLRYVSDLTVLLRHFIVANVSTYLGWPEPSVRFRPFKMADDLQRKALLFQYNQAQKVSDTTLLQDADLSPEKEDELLQKEAARRLEAVKKTQLAQAEVQGEAQVVMAKYQARSQTVMQREQMQAQKGMQDAAPGEALEGVPQEHGGPQTQQAPEQQPIPEIAQQMAQQLAQMPPEHQRMALEQIAQQSPPLANAVVEILSRGGAGGQGGGSAGAPMPEASAPRRGPEAAAI
jgi:hypothetical protein